MFRRVRFECGTCGESFVDWHDEQWQRTRVFCVNCGEPIAAGAVVDSDAIVANAPSDVPESLQPSESRPDTEPSADAAQRGPSVKAQSSAPRAIVAPPSRRTSPRRGLAAFGPLLLGFALGVPLTLLVEEPFRGLVHPVALARAELAQRLVAVSSAIDDGRLEQARSLLDRCASLAAVSDRRLATLRARLALALILANRPAEASREIAAVQKLPPVHPGFDELRRVYDALFAAERSSALPSAASAASSHVAPVAASAGTISAVARPTAAKPVTKREMLDFARDRQRRAQLDDAQRLYEAVLRFHPDDAEARCGLAELQLLRGSVVDAQALFERALQSNPAYIPAWVGLADIDWLHGRPERAACRYQAVIDRFPSAKYPPYIVERIARVKSSGVNPPAARGDVSAANACGS